MREDLEKVLEFIEEKLSDVGANFNKHKDAHIECADCALCRWYPPEFPCNNKAGDDVCYAFDDDNCVDKYKKVRDVIVKIKAEEVLDDLLFGDTNED